jgi:hypothetical protein
MKITKKHAFIFLIAIVTRFAIECLYDWKENKKSFNEAYHEEKK